MPGREEKHKVIYLSSELFINEFIDAIQHSISSVPGSAIARRLLLIDDIQFLGGRSGPEEFFSTLNTLFDGHKQIVLSSDRPASEIANLEHRLVSRLMGLTLSFSRRTSNAHGNHARKKSAHNADPLHDDVFQFLASRIRTNLRRWKAALMRVASFAHSAQGTYAGSGEHLLKDICRRRTHSVTIETIQRRVRNILMCASPT